MSDLSIDTLKSKLRKIDYCMPPSEYTITQDIKELLDVMIDLNKSKLDDDYFEEVWPKQSARQYLTGDFVFFLSKFLIEFKQFQTSENQRNANLILENVVVLCLRVLQENPDHPKAYETLRFVLDPERYYYRYKLQWEWRPNRDQLAPEMDLTEEQAIFVKSLKVGDRVDALKQDSKNQVIAWSRGVITEISEDMDLVEVQWEGENSGRTIERASWDIAPYKSKVPDSEWDWKANLKVGDIVDCPDENVWYNATVIKIFEGGKIRIGFRHYDEKGTSSDEMGKFFGWNSSYDEDVHLYSPRIQKPNTFAKAFCKYASLSNAEESIQDHNDFIYNLGKTKIIYAVPRFNTKHQRRSILMVQLIQVFGEAGGFELFYSRISDPNKYCPIESLHQIMQILGQMHEMLHREFVYEYVPKVLEAVQKNMLNSPDSNLRNFSYQRISESLQGLGNITKRIISLKEKNELVDKLDMEIAMRCFKSEFLERQIHGLKAIQDLIRRTKETQLSMANSDLKYLNVQLIVDWVNENGVFESIYTSQNNSYIVQRSSDFLKFMLDEKLVSLTQLEMIVKSAKKGEIEDKQAIYKILKDVSQSLSKEQLLFIIKTVSESPPQSLIKDDLDLLHDITKFNYRYKEDFNQHFYQFYWNLLSSGVTFQSDFQEQILNQFVDLLNMFEFRPQREQNLLQIGQKIQNDESTSLMVKVLMRFIDKLEVQPLTWDQFTREVALTLLLRQCNIIDSVFKSIKNHKQQNVEDYLDGIKVRTDFIQFFYGNITNKAYALDFQTVGRLWDELVENAKVPQERDMLYKWFSSSNLVKGVDITDIIRFFQQRLTKNLEALTEEGLTCLLSLVDMINSVQGGFSKRKQSDLEDDAAAQKPQQKYVVNGSIQEIFGFQTIQQVIFVSDDAVSRQARLYMISIVQRHINSNEAIKEYINYVFQQLSNSDYVVRSLQLLQDLLGESECYGVGDLKSIGSLSQGELTTVDFINQCTTGWQVAKRFSLNISENKTIFDMRLDISKKIRAPWDAFNIASQNNVLSFSENGKIIRDLRLKRGDVFTITKRPTKQIPEAELVDKKGNILPEAQLVFQEIFKEFSTDGLLNKEQCARFVTACTGNQCLPEDNQIARVFDQYDKDKDGFLKEDNFVEFYHEASKSKASTVWLNLRMMNYRNDLVRGDQVKPPVVDIRLLPKYLISRSENQMQILFNLLKTNQKDDAWNLLRRLPPSPTLVMRLFTLDQSCAEIFDSNSEYKLLYNLYLVKYLMDPQPLADLRLLLEGASTTLEEQQLVFYCQNWTLKFVEHGGFEMFLATFTKFNNNKADDPLHKWILSFLLKILADFLSAVYYPKSPFLYQTMKLAQSRDLNTEELKKYTTVPQEFEDLVNSLLIISNMQTLKETDELYGQLLAMVRDLLINKVELEAEDRQILEYAMMVVVCIVLHDPKLLQEQFQKDELLSTLMAGILTNKSVNLRGFFAKQAFLLANQSQTHLNLDLPTRRLFEQLVLQLAECSQPQNAGSSESYYELLSVMVETSKGQFVNYVDLATSLIQTLDKHESTESLTRQGPDKLIIGLLTLLSNIVSLSQEVRQGIAARSDLVTVIFNKCLFALNGNTVKCRSKESRFAAFKLLRSLCLESPENTQNLIRNCLAPLAQIVPPINSWNHIPGNDQRQNGYLGIKNLGCICYMIAMLQQFFLVPTFRYAILMAEDGVAPDLQPRPKDGQLVDDNVFHQFQKMFAFLELSDRFDYNPTDFCFALKDFTGAPVDVTIQQDSQEFLNMIFDRLETAIKPTPFKNLLNSVFGGKTVTQLTCPDCKHVRNKDETFFNISLPIKNQKNLQECFEKFISGEVISDYKCDNCSKKVDVTKRQMLLEMPNVLILHLQRIVFNLDTLMNEKINSRVEFPMELNLEPYLVDERKETEISQYKLTGVVVHIGAAEFGHYFSYIDINREQETFNTQTKWFEFNDSKVKEFKINNLENECFGGPSTSTENEEFGWWKSNRENSQNAYVLVYEKMTKTPIKLEVNDEAELKKLQTNFNLKFQQTETLESGKIQASIDYYAFPKHVPEHLASIVHKENQSFQLERSLYDPEFFNFLSEVCKCHQVSDVDLKQPFYLNWRSIPEDKARVNEELLTTLIPYAFDILARAYDNRHLESLVERMRYLLHISPSFSFQFLRKLFFDRGTKTVDILLTCPETFTRELMSKLLSQTFNQVIAFHQLKLVEGDPDEIDTKVTKSLVIILDFLKETVPKNWSRFEQYFQFWKDFAEGGEAQMQFLMSKKIVTLFLDFMLEGHSPLKTNERRPVMGNPYYSPNFSTLFSVCLTVIYRCKQEEQNPNSIYKLTPVDQMMLYSTRLIEKLLKGLKKQPTVSQYIIHMCRDNILYSEIVCSCVLKNLDRTQADELISLAILIVQLLEIDDSIQQLRIEWLLGFPQIESHNPKTSISVGESIPQFGVYGLLSLDEDIYRYPSPLHYTTSLLDLILQSVGHMSRNENHGIVAITALAQAMVQIPSVRSYVLALPAFNYTKQTFSSCFAPFVENYQQDSKRYYFSNFPREEATEECLKWLLQLKELVDQTKITANPSFIIGNTQTSHYRRKLYVRLQGVLEVISDEAKITEYLKQTNNINVERLCLVHERSYTAAVCPNQPTGKGNDSFPTTILNGTQIINYQVKRGSQASQFFEYKTAQWSNNNYYDYNNSYKQCSGDVTQAQDLEGISVKQIPDQTATPPQDIDGYNEVEVVRLIQVSSLHQKSIHCVMKLQPQVNSQVPTSGVQKLIKPLGSINFVTLVRQDLDKDWPMPEYDLRFTLVDGFGDALFVTEVSREQKELFSYR